MPAPCPGRIRYVLEIVVGPVVRHEVLSRSDGVEAGDAETRPAALESFVSIGPGNPKSIEPDVLADARMLRVGDKSDESEIPVEDQARAKKVVGPHRKVIGIAMAFARIAEAGDRRAFQCISKGGRILGREIQNAEAAEHVELAADVVVYLAVYGPPVEDERRLHDVVVYRSGQVGKRKQRDKLHGNRIPAPWINLVVGECGSSGA